jgi:predicted MFS family arabinose efflux permease
LAFIAVYFKLDLPAVSRAHWVTRLGHIDFLGASLLIIATCSLLVGLDLGSNTSWTSTLTISLLGASVPIYALFMVVEHYVTHPFAPSGIIFNRLLSPPLICNFFAFAGYMTMLFYIPLFFQAVSGYTSTEAGLLLIPGIVGSVTGSVGGGIIMQKTGKYFWLTIVGYTMMATGMACIFLCSGVLVTSTVGTLIAFSLTGLGGGISVTTTLIALVACADPSDMAIVTACSYLFRSLGSAVGVSLGAALVQQRLRDQLAKMLGDGEETEEIVRGVRESLEYLEKLSPEVREVVRQCYKKAVSASFGLAGLVLVASVISAMFIRERKLSR